MVHKYLLILGRYLMLMGRVFSVPERMRMFFKSYVKEMAQLGVNSIGIVLLISFFIGAVICIQMKLNIQSPCCSSSPAPSCASSLQERLAPTSPQN